MQRKFVKSNVYVAGKNSTSQELVLRHMCNHYRRILNAKKVIDNSPPYCYKAKRGSNSGNPRPKEPQCGSGHPNKGPASRNTSPLLTERGSISSNSYKGSCWGGDSCVTTSRYHVACFQDGNSQTAPSKFTCVHMDLVDRIAYDTKNGPAAYCDEGWREIKAQHNDKGFANARQAKSDANSPPNSKRRLPRKSLSESGQKRKFPIQRKSAESDLMTSQSQFFTASNAKFRPRILKTEAVSKVRSLRVYYPPRRKETRSKPDKDPESPVGCAANCKCTKICVCDASEGDFKKPSDNPKEQSQTSSRDSAYNGGVSSLPESRSPTPDQRRKECSCRREGFYPEKKAVRLSKEDDAPERPRESRSAESPRASRASEAAEDTESLKKMKEDALYVKFLQDITVEVLEKGLYTNKALKNVMRRHVMENLKTLDKDRMVEEVDNLRIQLGIPEDKTFLCLAADSAEDVPEAAMPAYPVISDSAFVIPPSVAGTPRESAPPVPGVAKDLRRSASEGMLGEEFEMAVSSEESEMISVIQVRNAILEREKKGKSLEREKKGKSPERERKGKSLESSPTARSPSRGNSGYESDDSAELKKKIKNVASRMQLQNRPPTSSSESEEDETESGRRGSLRPGRCDAREKKQEGRRRSCDDAFDSERLEVKRSSSWVPDKKNQNKTVGTATDWQPSRKGNHGKKSPPKGDRQK